MINKENINIKKLPLGEVKLNQVNPRTISNKKLQELIQSVLLFPQMLRIRPMVVDKNNVVLGGNQRLTALTKIEGYKEHDLKAVLSLTKEYQSMTDKLKQDIISYWLTWIDKPEVEVIDASMLSPEKQAEFIAKDNLSYGEWDPVKLSQLFDVDQLSEWGFDGDIFKEVKKQQTDKPHDDGYSDEDAVRAPQIVKDGDIIKLGRHYLICGDSTNSHVYKQLLKFIGGGQIDLLITDPPYNVDYEGKDGMKIQNDKFKTTQAFQNFLKSAFINAYAALKPGGSMYVFYASVMHIAFEQALNESGLDVHEQLIWVKNSFILSRNDYHYKHEPVLYGWKPGAKHYFIDERDHSTVIEDEQLSELKKMNKSELINIINRIRDNVPTTVIRENKPTSNDIHPTMKPVPLIAYFITNSTREGDSVMDIFCGSGSTIIACEQTGRTAYGIELDKRYCDAIIDRWQKFSGLNIEIVGNINV